MKKFIISFALLFYCGLHAQKSDNTSTTLAQNNHVPIEEVTVEMLNSIRDEKIKKETPNNSKLVQKADNFFNKMWYAEAAEIYEIILSDESNYSFDLLKKAGDAYYYNTNMEKAYKWYDILYNDYKSSMTADNYFRYAHALKGNGRYSKAKRLMRLYNKIEGKEENIAGSDNSEVFDKIVNAKDRFEIKNVAINSKYSDFSPMFYDQDKVVFASSLDSSVFVTRKYKWNDQPFLDLYVSKINEESADLKNAIKFSKKINSKYHEASVTFSPDNETMYFTRNNYGKKLKRDKNGVNHLKIYKSVKIGADWTEPKELPFNSDSYSTGHPALSPDGKLLYFVSDMPGSMGASDIFVVDVLEDGAYSTPRNLGPEINTEKREMFPFITDKKLYFSSDGHVGLGGLDVFEATFDVDGFQEVKNVGKPVNSNKDDFSYIVSEKSQKGYFASNRAGGKGDDDIYSFERLTVEEVNNTAIAGVVTELVTGDVMPKALVVLLDENNIKLKEIESADDGSFVFEDLEGDKKYTIKTNRKEYFEELKEVMTTLNDTEIVEVSLKKLKELIVVEDGIRKLKTDMIYFNFDKSFIREDASKELNKLVEVMSEYPEMVIKIESHTDSRGASDYNRYLSDKRAKSSRDYIISQGIDADRIESAIGYGEDRLLNDCDGSVKCTREKHELNRRSEFIIVKM
ncbi:OmpA family protein [Cellulophaga sp. E16_2]|uniref:OmpA family protein n=1 Tax=Cellulophaga sp. E16_2 TaxID=2789297 RepID=UPI001A917BE4|nr:OmpA family protein [Cellulophaga sp. E16_2]MBO0591375.1 OmpA family protein [Cellulophaga sp. E16_2]